jgi:hypothetical protein
VSLKGYGPLNARLTAIGHTETLMFELGNRTVAEAKKRVRVKTRTTSRTIRLERHDKDSALVTVGGAGRFLEFGTRRHDIPKVPRKGRFLRFPAAGTKTTLAGRARTGEVRRLGSGAYVFRRQVHHPGTKPYPFLVPGAQAAFREIGLDPIVKAWNGAA